MLRGSRIDSPPGTAVRPTTDRAREAIFNALGSLGVVEDARVVDLFAGSGALGIEALSRGARHCVFVDDDRRSITVLTGNLERLGLLDRSRVVMGEAVAHARQHPADLVLADPPYDFDRWGELLGSIDATIVVAESDHPIDPEAIDGLEIGRWAAIRSRRYGRAWVTFLESRRPGGAGEVP